MHQSTGGQSSKWETGLIKISAFCLIKKLSTKKTGYNDFGKYQSDCPIATHQIYWQSYEYTLQSPCSC